MMKTPRKLDVWQISSFVILALYALFLVLPLFQRYALNHFIGEGTLDTIVWFVLLYLLLICGGALVLVGILMATGTLGRLLALLS